MNCPDRKVLLAFRTGELSEAVAEEVISHISVCADCQTTLHALGDADDTLIHRDIKPSNLMLRHLPPLHDPLRGCPREGVGGEGVSLPFRSGREAWVEAGIVKILDLGLALLGTDSPGEGELTAAGLGHRHGRLHRPGTGLGPAHSVDIRADIYSLGCTFYKRARGCCPCQEAPGEIGQAPQYISD